LKLEHKNVKREKDREIEGWNKKLATAESNVTKAQSALSKMEQEKKSLQKLIKQEREYFSSNLQVYKDKTQYYTSRKELHENEYKKNQKSTSRYRF